MSSLHRVLMAAGLQRSSTRSAGFAKLARVEPRAYLGEVARRAIRSPGAVTLARDLKSPEG